MKWIDETLMYMRNLFLDSFNVDIPYTERLLLGTTFIIVGCFYSFIIFVGGVFLFYGVESVIMLVKEFLNA